MGSIIDSVLGYLPIALLVLAALILLFNSVTIAKGDEIITLERKWFGKGMPDGRTVALKGEVGVQARILGPGFHLLTPFIYKTKKSKYTVIATGEVGMITARTGNSIPSGEFYADPVECNLFQDGEAFLKNGGQKGPQVHILPPGEHRINPHLFAVDIVRAVVIGENQIGMVDAVAGVPCEVGRIFGKPVDCDDYQDGVAFLKNGGQKGPQVEILRPGFYRINTNLFKVSISASTIVPGGHVGLVTAMDGGQIPDGHLLGKRVEGHSNFEKGEIFLKNGGQKGRQLDVLMPGTYRINTNLFKIEQPSPWVSIGSEQVGIVTVLEGRTITDPSKIAADEIDLEKHQNFQDADSFLKAGGQKGLQIPVLRAGNYAINPWFATIDKVEMVKVDIGFCGVVTSYVGEEGEDLTDDKVNAKIVSNGKKGIWNEPLQPGKHPLNTRICKVDIVPTTQILLNWADNMSSAHELDSNLSTITLRTADAFNVNMDVSVIIHIPMQNAPRVIANLGSVKNMISQVLEPAISSHFRNACQYINALDLYRQRKELQEKAKEHIDAVLAVHHIISKDTLIADVVLPAEITKPITDRQIATQEKITYDTQKEAQQARRELENATAQANMQPKVVESERNVEIQKNVADGKVKEAEGLKSAAILKAEGEKQSKILIATGESEAIKLNAGATSEATSKNGKAEAEIILAKGTSTAKSYELEVAAIGRDVFAKVRVINAMTNGKLKLIPDNLVMGGGSGNGGGNGLIDGFLGVSLLEKLTGQQFNAKSLEVAKEAKETTEEPKPGEEVVESKPSEPAANVTDQNQEQQPVDKKQNPGKTDKK